VWPIAVLVAHSLGKDATQDTLRAMMDAALAPGCPLHLFGLLATEDFPAAMELLRGANSAGEQLEAEAGGDQRHDIPSATPMGSSRWGGTPGAKQSAGLQAQQAPQNGGVFVPKVPKTAPVSQKPSWHTSLLMLAANRSPLDAVVVGALGDRLWEYPAGNDDHWSPVSRPDRVAAHVCYLLAGRSVENAFVPGSRFVLPGADHEGCPGTFATADALQRGELLAWGLQQSTGAPMYRLAPHYLMVCFWWLLRHACSK
jgi:hypothetical protein